MRGFLCSCLLLFSGAMSILALAQTATDTPKNEAPAHESKGTIEGLVRDIACPIQNLEATATHLSMKCLRACAKAGSPLVILTKDGELYVPISDTMPDEDQRQKLMPFLGKYVRASGTVYERKGTHAIAINQIEEAKDVHLTIEDQ
jgi:DNA/RNA endonuclease YhcR with UshA esterase domain